MGQKNGLACRIPQCTLIVSIPRGSDWCVFVGCQAHVLISSAQKRAELQQQTAAMEAKNIIADKEVQGLHAALMRLGGANQDLIESFK